MYFIFVNFSRKQVKKVFFVLIFLFMIATFFTPFIHWRMYDWDLLSCEVLTTLSDIKHISPIATCVQSLLKSISTKCNGHLILQFHCFCWQSTKMSRVFSSTRSAQHFVAFIVLRTTDDLFKCHYTNNIIGCSFKFKSNF